MDSYRDNRVTELLSDSLDHARFAAMVFDGFLDPNPISRCVGFSTGTTWSGSTSGKAEQIKAGENNSPGGPRSRGFLQAL
jgi:hypothetical protein